MNRKEMMLVDMGTVVNVWLFEPTKEFPTLNNLLGYGTYSFCQSQD
jgi:hypothetical protein